MKLKYVFENEFDKGFVDLYVNVTRQINPNISRDEIKKHCRTVWRSDGS